VPAAILAGLAAALALAPLLAPADPAATDLARSLEAASSAHPLGTDLLGRDLLARVLAGARLSALVGLAAAALGLVLGGGVGLLSAFAPPRVDALAMRAVDGLAALPTIVVSILLLAALGSSLGVLVLAIALTEWFVPARVVRAEARRIRAREFVDAARNLGAGGPRLLLRHVLPHLAPTLAAALALTVPRAILAEAFLSFIGLGAAPPAVSLGGLLAEAVGSLDPVTRSAAPLLAPTVALATVLVAVNAFSESLRPAAGLPSGKVSAR